MNKEYYENALLFIDLVLNKLESENKISKRKANRIRRELKPIDYTLWLDDFKDNKKLRDMLFDKIIKEQLKEIKKIKKREKKQ